jgi:hypothetical protein
MIKRTLMATGRSAAPGSTQTRKPDNPHFETTSTPTCPSGTHWVAPGYVRHGKSGMDTAHPIDMCQAAGH